jgi:predicted ATPase/DNA-binding CsgD family transcriptional regulator
MMIDNADEVSHLTPRELDILRLLAEGLSNRTIADRLVLSLGTIKWYNRQIYNKLGVNSRQEAVVVARQTGILPDPRLKLLHNLPAQVSPFIGRQQEQRDLVQRLLDPDNRLVTIVGSGGIGKTRLALEVAGHLAMAEKMQAFSDGIYFIDLAPVNNADSLITAIADALNYHFHPDGRSPKQQLLDFLRNKHLLLILDNFEHMLNSATLVLRILQAAPDISILVTSRERLNLSGETIFRLVGMDYPTKKSVRDIRDYEAARLFAQSAQRVRHDFTLEQDDLPHLARICRLVQGVPLALILAATWVEILSLGEIDQQITQSIDFLASEQRDLPRRLRSMRAVFDHSWNLMEKSETDIFMKLCVFRDGFTREASQVVAGADVRILINLANKSLVQHNIDTGRYRIHELLRQYAAQRLQASGQWESIQRRHSEFYVQLAERAEPELRLAEQEQWFHILESEHNNLRAAMGWAFDSSSGVAGLRIAVALRDFWFYAGYHVEAQQWYELALEHTTHQEPILYGKVLLALGLILWARHQMEECRQTWENALSVFREAGERRYAAWALGLLGGSKSGLDRTGYHSDIERIESAIATLREVDDQPGVAQMLNILGNVHRIPHNYRQAKAAYRACLETVRRTGEKRRKCIILNNLALVAYAERAHAQAQAFSLEGGTLAREIGFEVCLAYCLHVLAGTLAISGHAQEAARMIGAVDGYLEAQGISFPPNDQHYHDHILDDVHQQLDDKTFQASWNEGVLVSLEHSLDIVLQVDDQDYSDAKPL